MFTRDRKSGMRLLAVLLMIGAATPSRAAESFGTDLDPAPFDASTKADVVGDGAVTASLDGQSLTVSGSFSGLASNATAARLRMGLAMGVPGEAIGDLTVTHGKSGSLSGTVKLTAAQSAALRADALYVRIDSEKAPDGTLQGWLMAAGKH